jgi:hypothetical protein
MKHLCRSHLLTLSLMLLILFGCANTSSDSLSNQAATGGNDADGGGHSVGQAGGSGTDDDQVVDPGNPVHVDRHELFLSEVQPLLDDAAQQTAESLRERYAVNFETDLGYQPTEAIGMDLLQQSALALQPEELDKLSENGFVIVSGQTYPSFFYSYVTIYGEDLPVFVTADSILDALHRSFDDILMSFERSVLIPQLERLLRRMRDRLGSGTGMSDEVVIDTDFFLSVAYSLLKGEVADPVVGASQNKIAEFYNAAQGTGVIENRILFGVNRRIDFSQFKPRGHYEGDEELERYFRSMMWLGRIDLRMIETKDNGSQVFHRRQLETAMGLRALLDEQGDSDWRAIDRVVTAFVGEHDYMTVPQLADLLNDLGASSLNDLNDLSDDVIVQAIVDGGYGVQRICSHAMINDSSMGTLPLNVSFAFFGQRYAVDSHIFSNLVYDRVGGGLILRYLPNPLDAAFAGLGNDQAVDLLKDELEMYPFAPDLMSMRGLVDSHPQSYWQSSLYTMWLDSLRSLSPAPPYAGPQVDGLPTVARTEPWGRRLLNTQLGSWSELRHDTLLYVKQSYTTGTICEYPDAYVDPYPEFFSRLVRFAGHGTALINELDFSLDTSGYLRNAISIYFFNLARVAGILEQMAQHQRTGLPHDQEHIDFVNNAVRIHSGGSGPPTTEGWYGELFFSSDRSLEHDPIIADVHTDFGGERPSHVLHVATADPRLMVVTVDTCEGPRIYAGPVFSYHEKIVNGIYRMTDSEWQAEVNASSPPDVPWIESIVE